MYEGKSALILWLGKEQRCTSGRMARAQKIKPQKRGRFFHMVNEAGQKEPSACQPRVEGTAGRGKKRAKKSDERSSNRSAEERGERGSLGGKKTPPEKIGWPWRKQGEQWTFNERLRGGRIMSFNGAQKNQRTS